MNKSYRLIWSKVKEAWVIVAETVRGGGGPAPVTVRGLLLAALLAAPVANVHALPSGSQVIHGAAGITTSGTTMTITNSAGAIINWQGFSIGQGETARFIQPSAASSVLNRVIGGDPSAILGALQSNGKVLLINPNGILFGPNARVDVNGLIASTLNITNEDFLAGRMKFTAGPTAGKVENQGAITVPGGGQVYLLAADVKNSGVITAPNGDVLLVAGKEVLLVDRNNPEIAVVVTSPAGETLNLGTVVADAGRVGLYGSVVRQKGRVSADSAVAEGGRIFLRAAKKIELAEGSVTSANGVRGGEVLAITSENGTISGELTAKGIITAKGDGSQGSGGFVETSAARVDLNGVTVDTGGGNWLIDPTNFTISAGSANQTGSGIGADTLNSNLATNNITLQTAATGSEDGDITVAAPVMWSSGTSLTLLAHNNITVNEDITGNGNLKLIAGWSGTGETVTDGTGAISLKNAIHLTNADISLHSGGTVTQDSGAAITTGSLTVRAHGGIALNGENNAISTFDAVDSGGGDILLFNTVPLVISGAVSTETGLCQQYFPTLVVRNDGNITIAGAVSVIGEARLSAGGAVTQQAGGAITADRLSVEAEGGVGLGAAGNTVNHVRILNSDSGAVSFTNTTALAIDIAQEATGDITVTTIGNDSDITVFEDGVGISYAGDGEAALLLKAAHSVVVDNRIISEDGAGPLNVTLNAHHQDDAGFGSVVINRDITTNGGSLVIGGGLNPATTPAISINNGITINDAQIVTGGGAITMRGRNAYNLYDDFFFSGISIYGSTVNAGGGAITLEGRGGDSVNVNTPGNGGNGLDIFGTSITSTAGTISLTGIGGNGGEVAGSPSGRAGGVGLSLYDASITSTTGAINLSGVGGTGGDATDGYFGGFGGKGISTSAAAITSDTGAISLSGAGGKGGNAGNGSPGDSAWGGDGSTGIDASLQTTIASGAGTITLTGVGGAGGNATGGSAEGGFGAAGISVEAATITTTGAGGIIALHGTGGTGGTVTGGSGTAGATGSGISVASATVEAGAAAARINLLADSVSFGPGTVIGTGAAGTVRLAPITAGRTIAVDADNAGRAVDALGLLAADLTQVITTQNGTIELGDANTGDVRINAPLDLAADLSVTSGGAVTQQADAGITARHLAVQAAAGANFTAMDNHVWGISATVGSLSFHNAAPLIVNGTGISSGGAVTLTASGGITLAAPVTAGSGGTVDLTAVGGAISGSETNYVAGGALLAAADGGIILYSRVASITGLHNTTSGDIIVTNNSSDLPGTLAAHDIDNSAPGGRVILDNYGAATIGGSGVHAGGDIGITAHSPLTINGPVTSDNGNIALEAGASGGQDDLTINAPVTASQGNVNLTAGSAITGNGPVSAPNGTVTKTANLNLPTIEQCMANPATAGCSAVLPSMAVCTGAPTTPGCTAVLPSLAVCIADPAADGCTAVLPTIDTCTAAPGTAGCLAVLPSMAVCTGAPTTPGCTAVLPSLAACTADPAADGCTAVLPTIDTCMAAPGTAGCSAVLPSMAVCTGAPTTPGCTAVLPSLAACIADPAADGCSAVLPSLAACTIVPTTAGCSAVLPTIDTCTAAPGTAGCSAVLPSVAVCTGAPTTPGCSAVLPSLAACTTNPATAGCSAVLPSLAVCTTAPATAGCVAVLPPLDICIASPGTPGCSAVLPSADACAANPALAGCTGQQQQTEVAQVGRETANQVAREAGQSSTTPVAPAGLVALAPHGEGASEGRSGQSGSTDSTDDKTDEKDRDGKKDDQPAGGEKKDEKSKKNYCN